MPWPEKHCHCEECKAERNCKCPSSKCNNTEHHRCICMKRMQKKCKATNHKCVCKQQSLYLCKHHILDHELILPFDFSFDILDYQLMIDN